MDRRTFIGAAAGVGLAGISGCVASAQARPPEVPESRLEKGGWKLAREQQRKVFEREYAGQKLTATATTEIYGDAAFRKQLAEKTLGQITEAPASFFASRVTFDPDITSLPAGIGRESIIDEIESQSRQQLKDQMKNAGVEQISQSDAGSFQVQTGEDARQTNFEGVLKFGPIEFPVDDDRTVKIKADEITIKGHLGVWHHGDSVLVAGGAYPGENYARKVSRDVSSAVEVTVDIDLGLTPKKYRDELFGLMTRVE
ncbi:MAG: DUF6517 family protein [Halopenitus sp.]